jgi:hypothetical protein
MKKAPRIMQHESFRTLTTTATRYTVGGYTVLHGIGWIGAPLRLSEEWECGCSPSVKNPPCAHMEAVRAFVAAKEQLPRRHPRMSRKEQARKR